MEKVMADVFDLEGSLERMGGDRQLFGEMVGFLQSDAPHWLAQIHAALARGDMQGVHRGAHTLKGLISNFGAGEAFRAAAQVEQFGRQSDAAALPTAIAHLENAVEELQTALAPHHRPPA